MVSIKKSGDLNRQMQSCVKKRYTTQTKANDYTLAVVSELVRDKIPRQRGQHVVRMSLSTAKDDGISSPSLRQRRTQHVTANSGHAANVQVRSLCNTRALSLVRLDGYPSRHPSEKQNRLAATLRGSRPGVQSASLIMTSLMTS